MAKIDERAGWLNQENKSDETLFFIQSLIDAIPTPIFYKDKDGIYTGCNEAFEKFIGLSKGQIVGKDVYEVSPKELADVYYKADEKLFADRKPQIYETRVRYADGTFHDVVFHKAPLFNRDGSLYGLVGVIFDITDRKRVQRELQASRDILEQRVKERTAELILINESLKTEIEERKRAEKSLNEEKVRAELYVDLMGHDINNMNQIAIGYLELISDVLESEGKMNEDIRSLLERPTEALKATSRLIDSVKKLQKVRAGAYEPVTVDVDKVLRDTMAAYMNVPGRDIKLNYVPVSACRVRANELLKDVFSNIIGNAIKHSRGPLTITVRLEAARGPEGGLCKVSVEDNGPGIPDELKKKLFDRLCLHRARAGGKGFGLCLIKILLDDFGGKFYVEDRVPGDYSKGCKFVVLLPTVRPAPQKSATP